MAAGSREGLGREQGGPGHGPCSGWELSAQEAAGTWRRGDGEGSAVGNEVREMTGDTHHVHEGKGREN